MKAPRASYRLQLQTDLGFRGAALVADYLSDLGISDLYVSPILQAAPASTHGYDVVDHQKLDDALGGEDGFRALHEACIEHDLGLIVDFVPNHMGVAAEKNRFWQDILEHGPLSAFADYFDIDWHPPKETLSQKLLLPVLADQYGKSIERGELKLRFVDGAVKLQVAERSLPLRPRSIGPILSRVADLEESDLAPDVVDELRAIALEMGTLAEPSFQVDDPNRLGGECRAHADENGARAGEYRARADSAKRRFARLIEGDRRLAAAVDDALGVLSGTVGEPASFDFLDTIVRAQPYRLSAWRLALEATNYRRFFDVNELASIRVEKPEVFDVVHRRLFELFERGMITGVRLDHVDGLFDPIGYLERLNEQMSGLISKGNERESSPYVVVEKILAIGENLPDSFRCAGTTGYEYARMASGVFVDEKAEPLLSSLYRTFTGDTKTFEEHALDARRQVLRELLASEVTMLSRALERLAERNRRYRDFSHQTLQAAIVEVMAAFPVYRTYVRPNGTKTETDQAHVNRAIATAIRRNPTVDRSVYAFLREILLHGLESAGESGRDFAMRFQQTTAPVVAKSTEDTAFYRYARLISENEVGGDPSKFGVALSELHEKNIERLAERPDSMTTTSTHDTKRGEDARARIAILSQMPASWQRTVTRLARAATPHRGAHDGEAIPSRVDEYFYYQTLVGVFPFGALRASVDGMANRVGRYMLKACREAKSHTSWLNNDEAYETGLTAFVEHTLGDAAFVRVLRRFCARLDRAAATVALGQIALKLCSPGVPDTYQGSEIWHQVLVDPDNRRPVDYDDLRQRIIRLKSDQRPRRELVRELIETFADGTIKLFVVKELLALRREPALSPRSGYLALDATNNCVAFARGKNAELICVVPRFPVRVTGGKARWPLGNVWGDAKMCGEHIAGRYRNVFTDAELWADGELMLADVFADFPVAVLVRARHP